MKFRFVAVLVFGFALASSAQDAPPSGANGEGQGGWGENGMMGRGQAGTVTAVAADRFTIKTETGERFTVFFSVNTRILKQAADAAPHSQRAPNSMQPLKPTEIKVGDAILAAGEVDATAKTVGALLIVQVDRERARQLREMQANYGKTWLMGKVTAIDGVSVTLLGGIDHLPHTFVADGSTTFRKLREPITLADVQVGDMVRVEGAVKGNSFLAMVVTVQTPPPGGTPSVPRAAPPAQ